MSKQCLDVQQMQHLQELGMKMKETMLYWCRIHDSRSRAATNNGKWTLCKGKNQPCVAIQHWEYISAYTLQDVLDALPDFINEYCLIIDMSFGVIRYDNLTRKNNPILKEIDFNDEDKYLIDAAYELLAWCIENKFVEMNKNE